MTGAEDPAAAGSDRILAGHADREQVIMAIGIAIHGVGTAEEQRRARRQLPRTGPVR